MRCHLFGGAQTGLHGSVHVSLPAQRRVLAGEEDASERARQPGPGRRRELRIEGCIAAARPWVVLPTYRVPRDQFSVLQIEPRQLTDECGTGRLRPAWLWWRRLRRRPRAVSRYPLAAMKPSDRGLLRLGGPCLFLVAVPYGSDGERCAKGARLPALSPGDAIELESGFCGCAVIDARNCLTLSCPAFQARIGHRVSVAAGSAHTR